MSLRLPSSPPLSQFDAIAPGVICNESTVTKDCKTDFCDCTYTLDIPLGALVELILIDEGTKVYDIKSVMTHCLIVKISSRFYGSNITSYDNSLNQVQLYSKLY